MPIIDQKSDLAFSGRKRRKGTIGVRAAGGDAARLLLFLTSTKGLMFAAKQKALDPDTALKRMAGLLKQGVRNGVPFGFGGNTQSVFTKRDKPNAPTEVPPTEDQTKEARSLDSKYFVKSKLTKKIVYKGDTDLGILDEMDIVPFYFTALDTVDGKVKANYHLGFRAFFNTITDNTTGGYNPYNFVGRGESFFTYGTYGRTANLGFKVAALSEDELGVMHDKVEVLRKMAAPKYTTGGFMQGNFINLTVGNVYKNMPGIITSVNATVAQNVPWEIEKREQILPHVLDISVGFTILESSTPRHYDMEPYTE